MNRRERRAIKAQAGDGAPAMSAAASLAFSAGLWEQQAGLLPQAAASFRKALAQAPRHPDIHN
ncbi:MAG TPA: hypothetical protein VFA22_10170, partial [Stellaceae bacterium]|nr:hypothetical protein [Stellaceae bacterium]